MIQTFFIIFAFTMSNAASYHHIVINTKRGEMTIPEAVSAEMYRIIAAQVRKCGAIPIAVNGIGNHVHLLVNFGPETTRASLLQAIKQNSSLWAKHTAKFPQWDGWAKEYYCYSVSADRRQQVSNYIKNQKTHHLKVSLLEEVQWMNEVAF